MPVGLVYIFEFLFVNLACLLGIFLRKIKISSMHRLKLGFVYVLVSFMGLLFLTTLNAVHIIRLVNGAVDLKC